MTFYLGLFIVGIAFGTLALTFMSISRLESVKFNTGEVQWKTVLLCYVCSTSYITGRPLRPLYGYSLLLVAITLYPAAFAIGQGFDGTFGSSHFLVLSRLANILCQLCDWPAMGFCLEYLGFRFRSVFCVAGFAVTGFLLLFNPIAFFGYWPPFMTEYVRI